MTDSTGKNHPFNAAFSSIGGGNPAVTLSQNAAGGPLGKTAAISTVSTHWGYLNLGNSGMWVQGANNTPPPPEQWGLPAVNWVVEAWVLPEEDGASGGSTTSQFLSTGSGQFGGKPGGIAFRTQYNFDDDTVSIGLFGIGDGAAQVGDWVSHDKTKWMHVAAVNDNGVTTFYVNGVANGAPSSTVSAPSGVPYIGSGQDTGSPFKGFLDEIRYSTFEAGKFEVADLLLRPPGPGFISQPKSASVWNGGAAPFIASTVFDSTTTYQWKKGGQTIEGATGPEYLIPAVTAGDSGGVFTVTVTTDGGTVDSSEATLTVVDKQTENNNFYRQAINAESSLVAYFPIDGDTAGTATNVKNPAANGTLQEGVSYDGRTDRSYGERALRFSGSGEVTLEPNEAFEFSDGTGSIEALVYAQTPKVDGPQTIFSVASDSTAVYYALQVSADGTSLSLVSDTAPSGVAWPVPTSLLNRLAHVALVFNGTKVTAFADGVSLGAKDTPEFGGLTGLQANIGSAGPGNQSFNGTIDELAIYADALSDNAIAIHNSRFVYGTAVTAPTITSSPSGTLNVLAGGAPVLKVVASGTAPLAYQWKLNGAAIQNNPTATTATLTVLNSTVASSGTYTVTVSNPIGEVTSNPFTINFTAPSETDKYGKLVLADGPTGFWRLDELTGDKLTDYAGGFDGTYSTTVERGLPGAPGTDPDKAAGFSNSASPVSNAVVPYTPVLNPTGPFSIEFWAKPAQSGQANSAVLGTQNRNTGRAGYAVYQGFNVAGWEAHLGFGESVNFIYGTTVPAAGRWDHVVVTWDGVSKGQIFVNGKNDTSSDSSVGGPLRANTAQPLEIGSRFNGSVPYNGSIDEVAFYNYALTPEQIEKHFSISYFPSAIVTQPPGAVSGNEANDITISVEASGFPNTYQWFKNGVALEPSVNLDGTPHYPTATVAGSISQGVNGPKLVIAQATPDDNGAYQLVVTNPLGGSQSINVTVNVAPDLSAPTITQVSGSATQNRVKVKFNKPMLIDTTSVAGNYTISGGVTVDGVQPFVNDTSVVNLMTSPLTPGKEYTLTITGVKDSRKNQNSIGTANATFKAYSLKQGVLAWDYYPDIPGTSVNDILFAETYPYGVYADRFLKSFSTMEVTTGGNLNNNPDFGPKGDNYGAHVYGWLTPAESGNYQFFLRSDDGSTLNISSDSDPANAYAIANEATCCGPFEEPTVEVQPPETSEFIALEAGKSYYIEAFYKEGGGGDYVEVAWRKEGDATPAGQLTPIPGTFLSAYAPADAAKFNQPTLAANGEVTFTWTGSGVLEESSDLITWTPVGGNPGSGLKVTPAAGTHNFYRLKQ
jgi:hypothetical protein